MLKQDELRRMFLEMQLSKRVLDLVIDLLGLNQPYLAFSCAYRVARSRHGCRIHEASNLFCSGDQCPAIAAYRILRQRPSISASFIGTLSRKHSDAAEIRYGTLSDGLERMNDSTLTSIPSRNTFFSSSGMTPSFEQIEKRLEVHGHTSPHITTPCLRKRSFEQSTQSSAPVGNERRQMSLAMSLTKPRTVNRLVMSLFVMMVIRLRFGRA